VRYEEFKGALWSAGSIGIGRAWLCTGRNLAYRRKVWDEVGGFTRIRQSVSGDDDLFLQLVRKETSWKMRYAGSPSSHVPTAPPDTFDGLVQQRTRHFSAGKFFPLSMKIFSTAFHGANALLYAGLVASFLTPAYADGLWFFLIKSAFDLAFLLVGRNLLGTLPALSSFLVLEGVVLLYHLFMAPIGLLGSFTWKPEQTHG
jgi:hypothetical protein